MILSLITLGTTSVLSKVLTGAAIAGAVGVSGVGAYKMHEAHETVEAANEHHNRHLSEFEEVKGKTLSAVNNLYKTEKAAVSYFSEFADLMEEIHNRPRFGEISIGECKLPECETETLNVNVAELNNILAGIGGIGAGIGLGKVAGVAMATSSGLSGLLGIASLAAFPASMLFSGIASENRADEAWSAMRDAEESIKKSCNILNKIRSAANGYEKDVNSVLKQYKSRIAVMSELINNSYKRNWKQYTKEEKTLVENTYMLTCLLYSMCSVQLIENEEKGTVNTYAIHKEREKKNKVFEKIAA